VACGGRNFQRGDFFLLPSALSETPIEPLEPGSSVLRTTIPSAP